MSTILCIETATEICSVAVCSETTTMSLCENTDGNAHASRLTTIIDQALYEAGVTLQQLDAVAVSKGPGSYTGLRVGMSTAKGLCYALQIPMIAVPTLLSMSALFMAENAADEADLLVPMLDARRMEVYCAGYDKHGVQQIPTEAKIIDPDSFASQLEQGKVHFFGNGAAKCSSVISHPNARFVAGVLCSAKGMQKAAAEAFQKGLFEDVAYTEPFYLKDFVGTTPRKLV